MSSYFACLDIPILILRMTSYLYNRRSEEPLHSIGEVKSPSKFCCCSPAGQPEASSLSRSHLFFLGNRPATFNALLMINSNWPLILLKSSSAHFSNAFKVDSSTLRTNGFFFAMLIHLPVFFQPDNYLIQFLYPK